MEGYDLRGWEGVISGDVPCGAGLSSSAARRWRSPGHLPRSLDLSGRSAYRQDRGSGRNPTGLASEPGIMDQVVSVAARAGHAFFLDCRSLAYEHIPRIKGMSVVVMDTSTRRGLVNSAYNERQAQCEAAARSFGVKALRDVSLEQFRLESRKLDRITRRRARHVVTENRRVLDAVKAMRQ